MALITVVFFVLMFLGVPVAFAIGISGFVFFATDPTMPMSIGVQKIATMSQRARVTIRKADHSQLGFCSLMELLSATARLAF